MNLRTRLGDSPPRVDGRRDPTVCPMRDTPQEATATPSGHGPVADRGTRGTRAQRSADQLRRREARMLEVTDHEQQRIGQELHDGLGQRLTALEMRLFLLLMRHRARSIGASLAIESTPGKGVRITCTLPMERAQQGP